MKMKSTDLVPTAIIFLLLSLECHSQPCDSTCQALITAHNQQLTAAKAERPSHPLDPLTWRESLFASYLIRSSYPFANNSAPPLIISYIVLQEPPKEAVLAWVPGLPLPRRQAFAKAYQIVAVGGVRRKRLFQVLVDFSTRRVFTTYAGECIDEPGRGDSGTSSRPWNPSRYISDPQLRPKRFFTPASIERPHGVSFQVTGHQVTWGSWQFHVHLHPRAGLVISQAKISQRSVLYQGSLSELFVPSMGGSYDRPLNVAQFGIGENTKPLVPLTDCPQNAKYIPAVIPGSGGGDPRFIPNAICIFERYSADVANRHFETYINEDISATRFSAEPKITLVARSWATLRGNEDFGIDWEFSADGTIKNRVNIAGHPAYTVSPHPNIYSAGADPLRNGSDGLQGTFVAPFQVVPIHDHFANFRLDVDVDRSFNSFVVEELVPRHLDTDATYTQRASIYEVERKTATFEGNGQYNMSARSPAEYIIVDPSRISYLGNAVGYKLVSHNPIATLIPADDAMGNAPGFTRNSIWVTPYVASELWAVGTFPFCGRPDGLLAYTRRNRPISRRDIVVWLTIGAHHIPVQEDWYLTPAFQLSFELKPHNFFPRTAVTSSVPYTADELRVCQ